MKIKFFKPISWMVAAVITLTILTPTVVLTTKCQLATTQTASIYLDPSEILFEPDEVPIGHRFNVTAWVSNVEDLFGYQVALYYNASVIKMTNNWVPTWDSEWVFYGQVGLPVGPDLGYFDSWGYGLIGYSLVPFDTPTTFNGTGKLAIFEFEIIALPTVGNLTSDLIISYSVGGPEWETKLKDSAGDPIDLTATDGHYVYMSPLPPPEETQLYVDPPEIIDPTLLPPATVRINVTINDVEELYSYEFYLNYDTDMLTCTSVTINSVLNETHFTPKILVDDEAGTIYIKVSYYEPAEPITTYTPLALVTIVLRIDSLGSSVLDLNNTQLTDSSSQPITHEAKDGFIMTLIRDLGILNVTLSENIVYQGWFVNITVTAKNEGFTDETFNINVYYNDALITNQTFNLAPDQEITLTFTWNTATVEPYINYTIKVEIPLLPYEIDTTDNTLVDGTVMVKLMGDINGDQKVDIDDVVEMALAFGSYLGHPRWNPGADLNRDEIIDISDMVLAAINFGKHWP